MKAGWPWCKVVWLWVCLLLTSGSAWAHRTEVTEVTLVELGNQNYAIRYAAPPPGLGEFDAPRLPAHAHWVEQTDVPRSEISTFLLFACEGRPLTVEDRIVLPWRGNGVLVVAHWRNGTIAKQFFLSGPEGVVIELRQLQAGSGSWAAAAKRSSWMGVEHILGGIDHLLFVAGLMLLIRERRTLLWTVSAFTISHSLTLGLSVLQLIRVPRAPVEAVIALSVLLLAVEIGLVRRGRPGLTARKPWLVAFFFGLVHGLGFAGALQALPFSRAETPIVLLCFNLGVELGQLAFISAWLLAVRALRPWRTHDLTTRAAWVAEYAIGTLAAVWFFQRTFP